MEQSPSWEANRSSAKQEIPRILWIEEGSLPHSQEPILNQINSVHAPILFLEDPF
jgi:hypothetical protein